MNLSKHADARSQQRGIPHGVVDLILQHGTPRKKPSGAWEYTLRDGDKGRVISHLKQLIQQVEKATGKGVVTGDDGGIITVYHLHD